MTRSALVFLLAGTVLLAQDPSKGKKLTERMVQGTVFDADEKPVEGAVVQLKDSRTLAVRSFITLATGAYHFSGLKTDNDYQLKADHSGSTSGWKTLSIFDTRKDPLINLKLDKSIPKPEGKSSKQ